MHLIVIRITCYAGLLDLVALAQSPLHAQSIQYSKKMNLSLKHHRKVHKNISPIQIYVSIVHCTLYSLFDEKFQKIIWSRNVFQWKKILFTWNFLLWIVNIFFYINEHNATYLAKFVSIRWCNFENELATNSLAMSVETANPHNGLHNFSPCMCLRFLSPSPRVCVPFLLTYFVEVTFVGPTQNIAKKYVSLCVTSFSLDVKVLIWSHGFKSCIYQIFLSFRNELPKIVLFLSILLLFGS